MSAFPQLRILHLSDVHFHIPNGGGRSNHVCAPDDATASHTGFPTLLELIRSDLSSDYWKRFAWANQSPKLELTRFIIAATGDLVHTAKPAEYDQAFQFLNGLIQVPILGTKVKIEDIFVIPGNHDVVFDQREAAHRFGHTVIFTTSCLSPCNQTFAILLDRGRKWVEQVHMFRDDRFLIAEINSSYYVEKETIDESRGQVDMAGIGSLR